MVNPKTAFIKRKPLDWYRKNHPNLCCTDEFIVKPKFLRLDETDFTLLDNLRTKELHKTSEYVYFIICKYSMFIKIGYSDDPYRRLKQLQTGCPHRLELVKLIIGGYTQEQELHDFYSKLRVTSSLEWFCYSDEMRNYIKKLGNVYSHPGTYGFTKPTTVSQWWLDGLDLTGF